MGKEKEILIEIGMCLVCMNGQLELKSQSLFMIGFMIGDFTVHCDYQGQIMQGPF